MKKKVEKLLSGLLELIQVDASVEASVRKSEGEKVCEVVISPDSVGEAGLLIGAHGATLNAIQSFVALYLKQTTGEWIRVNLDVGDWRQKHNTQLERLAIQAAARAKESGEPQHLYNLSPSQRRVVHMALANEDGIETLSEGEGIGRYLVVKPKDNL